MNDASEKRFSTINNIYVLLGEINVSNVDVACA